MKQSGKVFFILLFFAASLCPLILIPVVGADGSDNGSAVSAPTLDKGGSLNTDYLKEWGEYFDSHYALRDVLVTGHNLMRSKLLRASTDEVLVGSGGWMYYASTLSDFQGQQTIPDEGLEDIRYNLNLMRDTLKSEGLRFVFTIAPNKAGIYPEYMPSGYEAHPETSDATLLTAKLREVRDREDKFPYADLFAPFKEEKQILYHMSDSHWNGRGGLLASWTLLHALGRGQAAYQEPTPRDDFTGDLQRILYPSFSGHEKEYYYDRDMKYDVTYNSNGNISDNSALRVETANKEKKGTLYMCHDTFGAPILPFMANEYGKAVFSGEYPFTLYEAADRKAKSVLLEVAEQELRKLREGAPLLLTQRADIKLPTEISGRKAQLEVGGVEMTTVDSKRWVRITGLWEMGTAPAPSDDVWVVLTRPSDEGEAVSMKDPRIFPAFRIEKNAKKGFELYLDGTRLPSGQYEISVLTGRKGSYALSDVLGTCMVNSVQRVEDSSEGSYGEDVTGDGNDDAHPIMGVGEELLSHTQE